MNSGGTLGRVEQVYGEAMRLPVAEREGWVRAHCAAEPAVRDEVLGLLAAEAKMGSFMQAPLLDFQGQRFGAYTALEEVGRGGMSVVYRGRRADGDFDKEVAIKVVLLQSPGVFRQAETQILAGLEHPNIARLLDAGTTGLGFRYLLMEFVEGRTLTGYCEGRSGPERLGLFLEVCEAVQYAHKSLVVHRDLKPENILVTGEGRVKLLDFGIAKMLDPEAGEDQTQGVRAFSPNYASPEQVLGQPVTTSTDVYSLGVLLCELMAGRPPRVMTGLTLEQMVDEARASVRAVPLKGDLGAIARKALRTAPEERYESAGALARDVERYLAGEPIEAREPTWGYVAGRFVSRHRYAVAAASLAAAALVAAASVALWQARKAEMRFEQVRELARAVMFELHDEVQGLPGSLGARKVIVDRSLKYLDALAADKSASRDVQVDLARGYLRLSDIEGKDLGGASLGRSGEALQHALKAVEIARRLAARDGDDIEAAQALVEGLEYSTTAYLLRGEAAKAIPLGEEAVQLAERLVLKEPHVVAHKERLATVTKQLADTYSKGGQRGKSLPLFLRALEMREALLKENPEDPRRQQRAAESHQWLGTEYWWAKDYAQAEKHASAALELDEKRYAANPRTARANVASDLLQLAMLKLRSKRHEEALKDIERALKLRREIAAEDPKSAVAALRVVAALDRRGLAYREWGRFPEAVRYGGEALAEARRVYAVDPHNAVAGRELVYAMSDLALTEEKAGRRGKACSLVRETLAVGKRLPADGALEAPLKKMRAMEEGCGVSPQ